VNHLAVAILVRVLSATASDAVECKVTRYRDVSYFKLIL